MIELLGETKATILAQLLAKPQTAGEIAKTLRIQASAVRKHLDQLDNQGIVQSDFQHSEIGRPKKVYSVTSDGKELFPRKYDAVLNSTVEKLRADTDELHTQALLGEVADDLAAESFSELMGKSGFNAKVEEQADRYFVTTRNCPILKTAELHRETICKGLHEEFLRRGLNASKVTRQKWILDGESVCTHLVHKERFAA